MVPDFVDVICKLPKIEDRGRIAKMDFKTMQQQTGILKRWISFDNS